MRSRSKAIATLALTAPVLTEIVSGNTPPHALLHPAVDAFLVAVYSLPLLLIRELSIRWRLRTPGIFLLGLAYGLLNEGLIAQTLIRYERVPVANFDRYACAAGVNFSWTALIVPWHALMAVLFPLALLELWFPDCAETKWLSRWAFLALAAAVGGGVVFLGMVRTPHFQTRAFLLAIVLLVGGARLSRTEAPTAPRNAPGRMPAFAIGACFYVALFLGAASLAGRKAPREVYFLFVAAMVLGLGWLARRYELNRLPEAAILALGAYFVASVFNGLAGFMHHSREAVICGAVLSLAFLRLWQDALRRKVVSELPAPKVSRGMRAS